MTMNLKRRIHIGVFLLLACFSLALTGCESNVHESEEGGLSVALAWQDEGDRTDVSDIRVWIFDAGDGSLVKAMHYSDVRTMASERYHLASGDYKVVTAVNLTSPFSANDAATLNDLLLSLGEASASPEHAYYGVVEAKVSSESAVVSVTDYLHRLMAELTVTVSNAPEAAVLTGTVDNAATGFYPGTSVTNTEKAVVTIPSATAQGAVIETKALRLMPTARGEGKTMLSLRITDKDGHANDFDIVGPEMSSGGKYNITLDYREMRAFMDLSSCTVDTWTDGSTESGEVLNPN